MEQLREHPLMLTLRDVISGNGFLAGITLSGRALMRREDDGKWWMYGVCPAGLAESGTTVGEAFLNFRKGYQDTLFDMAQQSQNFAEFKDEVDQFFNEEDADNEDAQLWEKSLSMVRTGGLCPPDEFSGLPRESPESSPSQIEIERLDGTHRRFTPRDNVGDTYSLAQPMAA